MKCPRCPDQDLARETVGGVDVEKCPVCQGLWLGVGTLEPLLKQTHDYTRRRVSPPANQPRPDSTIECPECGAGAKMIRIKSFGNSAVTFDGCVVCHGRWLDGGELAQLGEAGIMDRLRTKLKEWL